MIVLELLDQAGRSLYALLARLTLCPEVAEDLMQELALRLLESEGFARSGSKIAYARRAAMNLALDWRRSRRRQRALEDLADPPALNGSAPDDLPGRGEQYQRILDAVARLKGLHREAFVLHYIEQEPFDVIGLRLGRTPHQVRALCHKAVGRVRQLLGCDPSHEHGR